MKTLFTQKKKGYIIRLCLRSTGTVAFLSAKTDMNHNNKKRHCCAEHKRITADNIDEVIEELEERKLLKNGAIFCRKPRSDQGKKHSYPVRPKRQPKSASKKETTISDTPSQPVMSEMVNLTQNSPNVTATDKPTVPENVVTGSIVTDNSLATTSYCQQSCVPCSGVNSAFPEVQEGSDESIQDLTDLLTPQFLVSSPLPMEADAHHQFLDSSIVNN